MAKLITRRGNAALASLHSAPDQPPPKARTSATMLASRAPWIWVA
jgi:hypothetical protein